MKGIRIILAAALLAAFCSCHILDNNFFPASSRSDTQRSAGENTERDSTAIPPTIFPEPQADTDIFCTAVRFPKRFNWKLDSTYKRAACEIIMYKNGEEFTKIRAGQGSEISYDADMHHMIGNNLYTEYSSTQETVIHVNGDEAVRFEGQELLRGLLPQDGDLYTLSVGKNGYGFSFRKNGETILQKYHKVTIFGSLEDPNCPETGALYEDDRNRVVFCYGELNTNWTYHIVREGEDEVFNYSGPKLLDMKVIDDSVRYAPAEAFGAYWEEAYVPYHNPNLVVGCIDGNAAVYDGTRKEIQSLCGRDAIVYCNDGISAALYHPSRGKCSVYYSNGQCRFFQEECNLYTRRCATLVGDGLILAVNPCDYTQRPYIVIGDERRELPDLENGFISGIRVFVSQSN